MRPAVCGRWSQSPVLPGLWPRGLWDRVGVWERHLANSGETVREGKVCFCIQRFNKFGGERPKWEDQGEFLETPRVGRGWYFRKHSGFIGNGLESWGGFWKG